ncbi:unnamed protein product [Cylicocyclus nassatus]|uniref:ENTH domain-containing protein n=1 Tax=Cylicocyclus nassatus TaxID=53992 RepID=A0AA36HE66_CYLNA|nr:unnamed protein product [Cylicocyclus nassatus]
MSQNFRANLISICGISKARERSESKQRDADCVASASGRLPAASPVELKGTMSDLISGLTSLTKQISNNIPYQIKKLGESVHTMVMNYTEAENLVYEATNEDPWGPTGPQMKEIANYTFQYEGFHQVMNLLWKRMLEDNKNAWRRVYKSLTLLNHLLLHGSERVIGSARDHTFQMRALEQYKYVDDHGRDQGLNVRHRVKLILDLVGDDDKLRAQRRKVKSDNKDRYQGYTSEDIRMGRGGSFSSSSMHGYSDDWKDDTSSYKRKSSFEENRDEYAVKEVNSFQFPEESRRGSVSPELGFRQDPTPDDDFGDFATARSIPQQNTAAQRTAAAEVSPTHIPVISPPAPVSSSRASGANTSSTSFDLLGLDISSSSASAVDFFGDSGKNAVPGIIPPPASSISGMNIPPPAAAKASPAAPLVQLGPSLPPDLFSSPSATSSPFPAAFEADWTAAPPAAPQAAAPQPAFCPAPAAGGLPTTQNKAVDIFGDFDALPKTSPKVSSPAKSPVANGGSSNTTSTKIGSTWAGATGLIDLDNLAGKSTPTKQNPSLNQMQMNKQGANSPSSLF